MDGSLAVSDYLTKLKILQNIRYNHMNLYNEFIMNILNEVNILSCPTKNNSNTFELTVHTSCYRGLRLTLC